MYQSVLEDFYLEVDYGKESKYIDKSNILINRTILIGMDCLFKWGFIKVWDTIVIDSKYVGFKGEKFIFNN
ncbi:hypothetical protein N492_10080 [Clostridium botulinum B2 267]|uniref:hypothetical protein n=1 Tax=Clostridium botulinum TaxID=1491 RepID=UPI0007E25280|nr:hypothetical protein [Clostridium botulinum]KEI87336.1 hypothetical protein N492_10080 [Clostridium botulinum B2 267]